ncbi:MAG: hypothetical protein EDS66_08470 [Planctomycetota bacterium]|nr:MAG: hypothetical protein EDS66_08470 [Planctomycetota bacterium]MCQ3921734.1 hypothetical protein [Planctomycetota bacterium]
MGVDAAQGFEAFAGVLIEAFNERRVLVLRAARRGGGGLLRGGRGVVDRRRRLEVQGRGGQHVLPVARGLDFRASGGGGAAQGCDLVVVLFKGFVLPGGVSGLGSRRVEFGERVRHGGAFREVAGGVFSVEVVRRGRVRNGGGVFRDNKVAPEFGDRQPAQEAGLRVVGGGRGGRRLRGGCEGLLALGEECGAFGLKLVAKRVEFGA